MTTRGRSTDPPAAKTPPLLFECKLCGKVFDAANPSPSCPECDSTEVERVG